MKPMLAKTYDGQNVKGWLMSEKLDGVRAIWTGAQLMSRNGNKFYAPDWFTNQLPTGVVLDGELYVSRGSFQRTVSIARKKPPVDTEWQAIRYCVFDAPECKGGFETRLTFCSEILAECTVAEVVKHKACARSISINFSLIWYLLGPKGLCSVALVLRMSNPALVAC